MQPIMAKWLLITSFITSHWIIHCRRRLTEGNFVSYSFLGWAFTTIFLWSHLFLRSWRSTGGYNNGFDMAIKHFPKHLLKPSIKSFIVQKKMFHDSIPENDSLYPKARNPISPFLSIDERSWISHPQHRIPIRPLTNITAPLDWKRKWLSIETSQTSAPNPKVIYFKFIFTSINFIIFCANYQSIF